MRTWYFLSSTSEKISTPKNLARVAADKQNSPGVRESPEKAVLSCRRFLLKSMHGIRENAKFLNGIRDLTATREAGFAKILAQGVVLGKKTV